MSTDKRPWHIITDRPKVMGGQMDGATLYSQDLRHHLSACSIPYQGHNFKDLLQVNDPNHCLDGARVLSIAGPYAYLYHYHRELTGADYPIVRDIHGGMWTGYLMQEWLCAPLTRPGDVVIYPSFYARDLYRRLFPEVATIVRAFVSHPRFEGSDFPAWSPRRMTYNQVNIGCLGRLSRDKNLPDVLAAVALSRDRWPGKRVVLHLIGTSLDMDLNDITALWADQGGAVEDLQYWGFKLGANRIDAFFQTIDLLAFFSTSSVEALGRVVIEARKWSVPVCMARYAAVNELAPASHTVPVQFYTDEFSCHNGLATGRVDPQEAVEALGRTLALREKPPIDGRLFHAVPFCKALEADLFDGQSEMAASELSRPLFDLQRPPNPEAGEAMVLIGELIKHLRFWAGLDRGRDTVRLAEELVAVSSDPLRSHTFLGNVNRYKMNYGDLSGYPFQAAQLVGFAPKARINKTYAAAAFGETKRMRGGISCGLM